LFQRHLYTVIIALILFSYLFTHFCMILEKRKTKKFESIKQPFSKLPEIKTDVSDSQSYSEVVYQVKSFQISKNYSKIKSVYFSKTYLRNFFLFERYI